MSDSTLERLKGGLADKYQVAREIGAGGMATVYIAHDVKHDRDVAIKVLHPDLAAALGADRFLAEIKTMAKLQHAHILPLLDSGEVGGALFYVMPVVTGETLRARLQRETQLPIDDAVRITREVASALDYAHRSGVIHRDIKPENILLHEGQALVADFGIALALSVAGGQRMTQTGMSLGTPHYMSPEQAMGERTIDARSDVYSLGAVLYEMLTGEPPFTGATAQAIVAKAMTERPVPPHTVRDTVPAGVEGAVLKALSKLPADRFASAAEFGGALSGDALTTRMTSASNAGSAREVKRWRMIAVGAAGVAATVTAIALWSAMSASPRMASPVIHFVEAAATFRSQDYDPVAISYDGSTIAYLQLTGAKTDGAYVRRLDQAAATQVPGTAEALAISLSPDADAIAIVLPNGTLKTVALGTGAALTLAQNASLYDAPDWGVDGFIYYATTEGVIARVRASGGAPEKLSTPDSSDRRPNLKAHTGPKLTPGGRGVVFAVYRGPGEEGDVGVVDLGTRGTRHIAKGSSVAGVGDGYLFTVSADGTLQAAPFDGRTLRVTGAVLSLVPGVKHSVTGGGASAAMSSTGTLVYSSQTGRDAELVWVTRDGIESVASGDVRKTFQSVAISPSGDRAAVGVLGEAGGGSVMLFNFAQQTLTPFSREGALSFRPIWTPDGQSIAYSSDLGAKDLTRGLWLQRVDGSAPPSLLVKSPRNAQEISWVKNGKHVVFREGYDDGKTRRDLRYFTPGSDTATHEFVATKADESMPALAPDGRFVAYTSDESGRYEVYVNPFPGPGGRVQVSSAGGTAPVWAHSGKELFYRGVDGKLMVVDVTAGASFSFTNRRALFDVARYIDESAHQTYDISPDDRRFLFIKPPPSKGFNVIVNWLADFKGKAGQRATR